MSALAYHKCAILLIWLHIRCLILERAGGEAVAEGSAGVGIFARVRH